MIRVWVLPEHKLVVRQLVGEFTLADAIEATGMTVAHPDYGPQYSGLYDHRSGQVVLSRASLMELVRQSAPLVQDVGPIAIIVSSPVSWGITRMASVFFEQLGIQIRPFQTVAEARQWLGLPADLSLPFEEPGPWKPMTISEAPGAR